MKFGVKGAGPIHFRDEIRRALIFYTVIPVAVVVLAFFAFFIFYAHSSIMEVNQESNRLVCGELEQMVDSYGSELIRMWDADSAEQLQGNPSRLRQLQTEAIRFIDSMHSQLKSYEIEDILKRGRGIYAVDCSRILCDSYEMEARTEGSSNFFLGEYMPEYSWAEVTLSNLLRKYYDENQLPDHEGDS